jgi:hypothetical protein
MQIRTASVSVPASRDEVFRFLADVENLPKWAAGYCECLELRNDGWWAYTSQGEMFVEMEADDRTGVIDLRVGPSAAELGLFPLRVLPLPEGEVLVSFTFIQPAGLSDELYGQHCRALVIAMKGLIRRFGGGELHAHGAAPQLVALGLN